MNLNKVEKLAINLIIIGVCITLIWTLLGLSMVVLKGNQCPAPTWFTDIGLGCAFLISLSVIPLLILLIKDIWNR